MKESRLTVLKPSETLFPIVLMLILNNLVFPKSPIFFLENFFHIIYSNWFPIPYLLQDPPHLPIHSTLLSFSLTLEKRKNKETYTRSPQKHKIKTITYKQKTSKTKHAKANQYETKTLQKIPLRLYCVGHLLPDMESLDMAPQMALNDGFSSPHPQP